MKANATYFIRIFFMAIAGTVFALQADAAPDVWSLEVVNKWAQAQRTSVGKIIRAVQGWNGRLYSGFGDYNANTGPITLAGYDPVTKTFDEPFVFTTEAVYYFTPIFGRLYVPPIDPSTHSGVAVLDYSKGWQFKSVYMEHCYGITTFNGKDLWIVGSGGDHLSHAKRSVDDGNTWTLGYQEVYLDDDYSRFYFVGTVGGKMYLQSSSSGACSSYDGTTWTTNSYGIGQYGSKTSSFAGVMVLKINNYLHSFNGTGAPTAVSQNYVCDYVISDGALYTLGYDRTVMRTTNLQNWTTLSTNAPSDARSIGVLGRKLYVGTRVGTMWTYSEPLDAKPPVWVVPDVDRTTEGSSFPGVFRIKRGGDLSQPLTVTYTFSGDAENGVDFVQRPLSATIPAGEASVTVEILSLRDGLVEGDEHVNLVLDEGTAAFAAECPRDARVMIGNQGTGI